MNHSFSNAFSQFSKANYWSSLGKHRIERKRSSIVSKRFGLRISPHNASHNQNCLQHGTLSGDPKTRKSTGSSSLIEIHFLIQTTRFLMKYDLICFQNKTYR